MGASSSKPTKVIEAVNIKEEFVFYSRASQGFLPRDKPLQSMIIKNSPYVGTIIFSDGSIGTACLLEDGTVLTCLHVVLDYDAYSIEKKLRLIDFSTTSAKIVFVKNSHIYCYNITGIVNSGFNIFYGASASTPVSFYDYAVLHIDGHPVENLGGFFELDQKNHFSSAYMTEPRKTLAISGPRAVKDKSGKFFYRRYCSCSENQAAEGSYYPYQQLGNHYAEKGFSGQAILPIDAVQGYPIGNSILYAVHSYLDHSANLRSGVKVSEYLTNIKSSQYQARSPGALYQNFIHYFESLLIKFEVLRKATVNKLTGEVTPGEIVDIKTAIALLQADASDIIADKRSEAKDLGKRAWGKYGALIGPEQHQATGKPHFHDHDRYAHSHIFFHPPVDEPDKYFQPILKSKK